MKRLVGMSLLLVVRGAGPMMLPRPERLYFWFGEPIESGPLRGPSRRRRGCPGACATTPDGGRSRNRGASGARAAIRDGVSRARLRRPDRDLPNSAGPTPPWYVTRAFEAWNETGLRAPPRGCRAGSSSQGPKWPDHALGRMGAFPICGHLGAAWAEVSDAELVGEDTVWWPPSCTSTNVIAPEWDMPSHWSRRARPDNADPSVYRPRCRLRGTTIRRVQERRRTWVE